MRAIFILFFISFSAVFAQDELHEAREVTNSCIVEKPQRHRDTEITEREEDLEYSEVRKIFTPQGPSDPEEENARVVQYYYKAFQDNNTENLLRTLAPNYGVVNANLLNDTSFYKHPTMSKNQQVRMQAFHYSFPDLHIQVMELIAQKNRVFAYVSYSGTQKGPFLGLAPTNAPVLIRQFAVFSIEDGRIVHITEMDNEFSVMEQLGYVLLK